MSTKPKTWDGEDIGKGGKKKDPVAPPAVEPVPDEADLDTAQTLLESSE